jgi:hypothetical protein
MPVWGPAAMALYGAEGLVQICLSHLLFSIHPEWRM